MARYYKIEGTSNKVLLRERSISGGRISLMVIDERMMTVGYPETVDDKHEIAMTVRAMLASVHMSDRIGQGCSIGERLPIAEEKKLDVKNILVTFGQRQHTLDDAVHRIHLIYSSGEVAK